jgi:uncharacterized protein (TIGR00106 family)
MKIIADFCIVPIGVGPSVSAYVREIAKIIDASGLVHVMHANGTNIEGEMAEVAALIETCCARLLHHVVFDPHRQTPDNGR